MSFRELFGPDGLFSSWQERHAFLLGICETIAFWKPRHNMPADYEAWFKVHKVEPGESPKPGNPLYEYHYYTSGRACGVVFWLIAIPLEILAIVRIF